MVSGFLISPYDQDRSFSGDAIEIRIWSKTWAGVVGLKRFIISWFMVFSSRAGQKPAANSKFSCRRRLARPAGEAPKPGCETGRECSLLGRFRRRSHLGIVQVDVEAER